MADFASKGDVTRKVRPPLQLNNVLKITTNVNGGTKGGLRLISKICLYHIVPNKIGFIPAKTKSEKSWLFIVDLRKILLLYKRHFTCHGFSFSDLLPPHSIVESFLI